MGIEANMGTGIKQRKQRFSALALVAVVAWSAIAGQTAAGAQQAPSIVGSSPLHGLTGATGWINSKPLTEKQLKGKVVLVDFWAYSCINCLRSLPYIRAWADKYKDSGLVVIGVHTPEFDFEHDPDNVRRAAKEIGVTFPVAVDSGYAIWNAFNNEAWPALYFIDTQGRVRHRFYGEGDYEQSERIIQQLLSESGAKDVSHDLASVRADGAEAAADL
jgi:thiol-disulfide isomerase/thioredoxin